MLKLIHKKKKKRFIENNKQQTTNNKQTTNKTNKTNKTNNKQQTKQSTNNKQQTTNKTNNKQQTTTTTKKKKKKKTEPNDKEKLIFACSDGDLSETKRLLSIGEGVNTTDQYGHSLVWLACYRNQSDIVKVLLLHPNLYENRDKISQDMTDIFKSHNDATKLFLSVYVPKQRGL